MLYRDRQTLLKLCTEVNNLLDLPRAFMVTRITLVSRSRSLLHPGNLVQKLGNWHAGKTHRLGSSHWIKQEGEGGKVPFWKHLQKTSIKILGYVIFLKWNNLGQWGWGKYNQWHWTHLEAITLFIEVTDQNEKIKSNVSVFSTKRCPLTSVCNNFLANFTS